MAEAQIIFFLDRVGRLLIQEGDHLLKIQEHVEWIQKELESMVAFLKEADRRQQRDELVAAWVKEVRNLVYDAEDIIDEYVAQMDTLHWFSLSVFKYLYVKRHTGNQIVKIKKRVIEINERKERYGFRVVVPDDHGGGIGGSSYRGPGGASPFVQLENIVGIEDDVEQLVKMLLEGNRRDRLVISVFGMGGLGKTTLVKEVFKGAKMKFDCYAWVYVSQSCTLRDALKNILFRFMESRGEPAMDVMDDTMDEGILQERTYHYLEDKKFLLVLDDIWENRLWEEINHSFPSKRGRIIFTTRIRDIVASTQEENFQIYDLQPLPYELAWQIFCRKAFRGPNKTCPEDIKGFAEAIVRRCGGLPLAVVAIGGVLATRGTNLPAWQSVLRTLDWEVSQHRDLERLNNALLFSYNYLPYYLKHCFLHVGLFPEDHNIGRKRLIRMWTAEGFVKEIPGKTLEEVANHYFMQLIDRSMIQAVTLHARDVVKACKVHDLMRDIANHMLKEENFGAVLGGGESTIQERQRRLAIYDHADNIPPNISKLNLRSLLMFRISDISSSDLQKILGQLKLARVLDLQGVLLEKLPEEIGELIHLRYLGLRGTLIENLPKSLQNLRNLQTLDIRKTNVRCLPAGCHKLQQLRHLLLSSFRDREKGFLKIPQGRMCFVNLQTLSGVEADDEDLVKELKGLTSLRKLSIRGITGSNSNELCNSLEGMKDLRSLTIVSESPGEQQIQIESLSESPRYLEKLKLQVYMKKLPKWFDSLGCLHTLYLFKNFMREDPFPVLEKLPNLVILTLASAFSSKDIKCKAGGFPKLKLLRVLDTENWVTWMPIEEGTLPKLQYLLIADCPKLRKLPDGFQHLTALQDLTLAGTSAYFSYRLRGVDRWKVNHVQEVSIVSQVNGKFVKQKLQQEAPNPT